MSPTFTIDAARDLALGLEVREKARLGGTRDEVRARVARRVGVAPGTLETLVRRRLKRVEAWVFARLASAAVADLTREIERNERELELAASCVRQLDPIEAQEVATTLATLRQSRASLVGSSDRSADGHGLRNQ